MSYTNWTHNTSKPSTPSTTHSNPFSSTSKPHSQNLSSFSSPFPLSAIQQSKMLLGVRRSLRVLQKECFRRVSPAVCRGVANAKEPNPNHPTPLSIEKLKYFAESQDNMPVRLSLARFISTELPIRFAVVCCVLRRCVGNDLGAQFSPLPAERNARHDRSHIAVQPLPGRDHQHEDPKDYCRGHGVHGQAGTCPARSAARVPPDGMWRMPVEGEAV